MDLRLTSDFPDLARKLNQMREDVGRKALASALNKAVNQARVQMQRGIVREFNVSTSYVRERLKVRKAFAAGRLALSAELKGGGKRRSANIIAFVEKMVSLAQAAKRRKDNTLRVLRVKVRRGAVKPLRGAFIGNQGRTVFKRTGKEQLPIEPVRTIDVAQMFNTRRINAAVIAHIKRTLPQIFEREARFYLERANK